MEDNPKWIIMKTLALLEKWWYELYTCMLSIAAFLGLSLENPSFVAFLFNMQECVSVGLALLKSVEFFML